MDLIAALALAAMTVLPNSGLMVLPGPIHSSAFAHRKRVFEDHTIITLTAAEALGPPANVDTAGGSAGGATDFNGQVRLNRRSPRGLFRHPMPLFYFHNLNDTLAKKNIYHKSLEAFMTKKDTQRQVRLACEELNKDLALGEEYIPDWRTLPISLYRYCHMRTITFNHESNSDQSPAERAEDVVKGFKALATSLVASKGPISTYIFYHEGIFDVLDYHKEGDGRDGPVKLTVWFKGRKGLSQMRKHAAALQLDRK